MGLDMYAYVVDMQKPEEEREAKELMYWRKVRQIHNLMEQMWRKENPNSEESFNCIPLELDKPKLDTLEMYLINPEYHDNSGGFFFGHGELSTESIQDTMGFIKTAREELDKGNKVFYDSWW